ncbi:Peptidase [Oryctes borbonicus]|uniref:Peptidase n=1 Tax=Oryctes borbonicus TaxID=1629725 RepID=A0A0T6B657_9SCAR|nr:Peptidase [Oryctes borbonicus]
MSSPEDDWTSTSSSNSLRRRSGILPKKATPRFRPNWLKDSGPIAIDDDDDEIIEMKKPAEFDYMRKSSFKHTSTPNFPTPKRAQNGDDDVTFVKYTPPNEGKLARKRGFDNHSKPSIFSFQNGSGLLTNNNKITNGARKKDTAAIFGNNVKCVPQLKKIPSPTSAVDHSFRLDEKRKYKELLSKMAPNAMKKSLLDSFAEYSTPVGKIFPPFRFEPTRSRKLIDLALKSRDKKVNDFIDLTSGPEKGKTNGFSRSTADDKIKPRRSATSTKIENILKEIDNEVVVKDSDSDVEILPTPPSPKPDFPVEKCNSLKTFVHPSQPTHDNWFNNEIKKHGEVIERTQKLIEEQKQNVQKFNSINDELRVKLLREKVSECLHIKDLLVPDESKEVSTFPELTPKQEALISDALDQRQPNSEILSRKFNMNITRQDLLTLSGLNWLNDEVINFYMNLIIERGKMEKWPKAYALNTFFYPKIINGGQSSVRRWTRKVDIFSYDLIAIPIHLKLHWCMAIIDFRKKRITYYDSMGSSNMECLRALMSYLKDEHLDKKKTEFDASDWRLTSARDIPQQMNGSDCGMFSCTFAEVLTRDAEINFSQEHMPYLRRKMVLEILESRLLIS